jgi:pimeloyl-ACP methyl ester carboxylesterase
VSYPQQMVGSDWPAHDTAKVNGVELHYAHAGDGPLILFLHGFPQCWYQYRDQLAEFSRDHLAVALDLRGYNLSSKPDDVHAYLTCTLVEDIRQLVEQLGYERLRSVPDRLDAPPQQRSQRLELLS